MRKHGEKKFIKILMYHLTHSFQQFNVLLEFVHFSPLQTPISSALFRTFCTTTTGVDITCVELQTAVA